MKLSIQTANILDRLGPDKGFELIHDCGFDCVDFTSDRAIPCLSPYTVRESGASFSVSDEELIELARPFKEAAEKHGVAFGQMHAPVPSWSLKPAMQEYAFHAIEKALMLCQYLHCPQLIVHPFFLGYEDTLDKDYEWELNIRQYTRLIPTIRKYGITVCLENMFTSRRGKIHAAICQNPDETIRYIDTLNEIAGEKLFAFCLDVGHAQLVGTEILGLIKQLGHRIETLHLHDNNGNDDQHLAPYMGIVDWDRFCRGMREIGYQGTLNFETHSTLKAFPPEMMPECLRLIAAAGRLFARKIEQGE